MSQLSRFSTTLVLLATPFLFSGCSDDGQTKPEPQDIKGIANQYYISVAPTGRIHSIYIEFTDQDNKFYKMALNPASPNTGQDQAGQTVSIDNYFRSESTVAANEYNQKVLMRNNAEFDVFIEVRPEKYEQVGTKSIDIKVPSTALCVLEYLNEGDVIFLTNPDNRDHLSDEIQALIGMIHDDPTEVGSEGMRFAPIIK